jgi:hypothetical protein
MNARAIALALPLMSAWAHRVRPQNYGRRAAGMNRKHDAIKPEASGGFS